MRRAKPTPVDTEAPTGIGPDLERLARAIAEQAIGDDLIDATVQFTDKVSAFKALSNYYAMRKRIAPPFNDEPGAAFSEMKDHPDDEADDDSPEGGSGADPDGNGDDGGPAIPAEKPRIRR